MASGQDSATEYQKMLVAMQQTFDIALNEQKYKNGAFKNLINAHTPPIDTLNILLASPLVTEHEKTTSFRPWRNALISIQNKDAENMSLRELISETVGIMGWTDVFDRDHQARGGYVPPLMMQSLRDDGTVNQTTTVDNDGSANVTDGGAFGEVPGAPAEFNAVMANYAVELGLAKELAASDVQKPVPTAGQDESNHVEDAIEAGSGGNRVKSAGHEGRVVGGIVEGHDEDEKNEDAKSDRKGNSVGKQADGEFDAAFRHNIRNAFL